MEKQTPLISIAMTSYNGEKYIKTQLESILNQTYKNIEIVVCDDCSTDKTAEILKEYAEKYDNIRVYFNSSNAGVNKNFERAINYCRGDYIAISDQDDIWIEDKLEFLIDNIGDYDVICAKKIDMDDNNNILPDIHFKTFEFAKVFKYDEYNFLNMYFTNILWGCTSLIKRSFLLSCLPFPMETMCYDHWICLCAFTKKTLKYSDTCVLKHIVHDNNYTRNKKMGNKYIRWIKSLSKDNLIKYYDEQIKMTDYVLSRLDLDEKSRDIMLELKEINKSALNFAFSKEDLRLLKREFILYKKISRPLHFFLKSVAERMLLAVFFHRDNG